MGVVAQPVHLGQVGVAQLEQDGLGTVTQVLVEQLRYVVYDVVLHVADRL